MKRFIAIAAFTLSIAAGTASNADAQIVYGYSVPTGTGVATTGTSYSPWMTTSFNNFYSPWLGIGQSSGTVYTPWGNQVYNNYYNPYTGARYGQSYSTNFWGTGVGQTYGYNPLIRYGYGAGFVQPNAYVNPYYGYGFSYGHLFRR
jgi:hypothetical protein